MKKNKELKQFYDKIYRKGYRKHFTTFVVSAPTSDVKKVLSQISWGSKKVLEVGCGTGLFAYSVAKKGGKVTAIDYSEQAIDIAKSQYFHSNLDFQQVNISEIKEKFNVIVSNGTLEHMDDPLKTLKLFKRLLNPKGHIIITSPNWTNLRGYVLLTLWYLFNAPITLADLHYLTPVDFQNFAKKLKMKMTWETFDRSWSHGDVLIKDFERRIPNILCDTQLPYDEKRIKNFMKWIKNIVLLNNDLPHSGATGLYHFRL